MQAVDTASTSTSVFKKRFRDHGPPN